LIRAGVFARAGLLEEAFESYLEDADFGLRCAALGIRGRYVPEARAIHVGSASLGAWHAGTVRRMARNQVFLAARHPAAGRCWPAFVAQSIWTALAFRHGAGLAAVRGKWDGLRRFAAMRRGAPPSDPEALEQILRSNEQFIRSHSADTYWRLYFLLTGGAM
jgi:GT2 family glycosyltransferase